MATLESIRKRTGLMIGFVVVGLGLFIVGDYFNGNNAGPQEFTAGLLNGSSLDYNEYSREEEKLRAIYQIIGQNLDDKQLKQTAWNNFSTDKLLEEEFKAVGLTITNNEIEDVIYGANQRPDVQQFLQQVFGLTPNASDSARTEIMNLVKNLEMGQNPNQIPAQQFQQIQGYWILTKENAIRAYKADKLNAYLKAAAYVTTNEAQYDFENKSRTASVEVVGKKFTEIDDSSINYTEDEVRAYYNAHKNDAKYALKDEAASIKFAIFPVQPTQEDYENTNNLVTELKNLLASTDKDSLIIVNQSPNRTYQLIDYKADETIYNLDSAEKVRIANASVNETFGPYLQGRKFKYFKVKSKGNVELRKAKHILLQYDTTDANAVAENAARMDSLYNAVKSGADFGALAAKYGTDGTKAQGGDLGWFDRKTMVKPFADAVYNNSRGSLLKVKTQFGYHLVKVDSVKTEDQFKVALFEKEVLPSEETRDMVYNNSREFALEWKSGNEDSLPAQFNVNIQESKQLLLGVNSYLAGVQDVEDIKKWAFANEEGKISAPIDDNFTQYVVVKVVGKSDDLSPSFEMVKEQMEQDFLKEKKAEVLAKSFEGKSDLNALAVEQGTVVQKSDRLTFASGYIPALGNDPVLVGSIFGMEAEEVTTVVGEQGVYLVKVLSFTEAQENPDVEPNRNQLLISIQNKITAEKNNLQNLKDVLHLKDRRLLN